MRNIFFIRAAELLAQRKVQSIAKAIVEALKEVETEYEAQYGHLKYAEMCRHLQYIFGPDILRCWQFKQTWSGMYLYPDSPQREEMIMCLLFAEVYDETTLPKQSEEKIHPHKTAILPP